MYSHYECCFSLSACTCQCPAPDCQSVLSLTSKFRWRNNRNVLIPNNTWYKRGSRLNLASLLSDPNYPLYHHYKNTVHFDPYLAKPLTSLHTTYWLATLRNIMWGLHAVSAKAFTGCSLIWLFYDALSVLSLTSRLRIPCSFSSNFASSMG